MNSPHPVVTGILLMLSIHLQVCTIILPTGTNSSGPRNDKSYFKLLYIPCTKTHLHDQDVVLAVTYKLYNCPQESLLITRQPRPTTCRFSHTTHHKLSYDDATYPRITGHCILIGGATEFLSRMLFKDT